MQNDVNLVKLVHAEIVNGWQITANLSRFGGLAVFARDGSGDCRYQSENILEAREWASKNPCKVPVLPLAGTISEICGE